MARGNGKSALLAGLTLYNLAADGEQGAEVVSAATAREQAKIVFGDAKSMLEKKPALAKALGLRSSKFAIVQPRTHSTFKALSRDAHRQDGLNIHFASIDELHAHKTRETYDVVETATAKRDQSMLFVITTAGSDTSGICYEVRSFCTKVLAGDVVADSQFAAIYTIDDEDNWTDPAVWPKANPNWNVSVQPDVIAQLAQKAQEQASAQNNFKTKHLNVWCSAASSWMNMTAWDRCADPTLTIDQFEGEGLWVGMDLSSRIDIAGRTRIFRRELPHRDAVLADKGRTETHYYLFADSYLPEATVANATNASYAGWAKSGWLKQTPGQVLDFAVLREDTVADRDRFALREVPYDPWQATQLAGELLELDVPMVEYRMTVANLSPAMKEFEALVKDGRLHHNGDPCLRWQVSNVVCFVDAKDNVYPRKSRPESKIDSAVAGLLALGRAMLNTGAPVPAPTIEFFGGSQQSAPQGDMGSFV